MNYFGGVFSGALLAVVPSLPAAAIEFDTGKWQITMQSQNPASGQPITETTMECIKDSHFDPSTVMMEDGTCRIPTRRKITTR